MLPYRESRLTVFFLAAFFILAAGYALFVARGQIIGPVIALPPIEKEAQDPYLVISGKAVRISKLSMNGLDIAVTKDGDFKQPYVLSPGYNRIVFDARDSYGRKTERIIEIMYQSTSTPSSQLQ